MAKRGVVGVPECWQCVSLNSIPIMKRPRTKPMAQWPADFPAAGRNSCICIHLNSQP